MGLMLVIGGEPVSGAPISSFDLMYVHPPVPKLVFLS